MTKSIYNLMPINGFLAQSGTSITEAMILMIIVIPLCTLIPTLAKIAHFKMQVPQASRYLGWQEAMTGAHLSNNASQIQIQERILKSNKLAIQTHQQDSEELHQVPLWSVKLERIHNTSSTDATNAIRKSKASHIQGTTSIISGLTSGLSLLSKGDFVFETEDIAHHEINFSLNTFGLINQTNCEQENSNNSTLCLSQKHAIYTNSLAAKNDQQIQSQVNSLKPLSTFNSAANTISNLATASWIFQEGSGLENAPLHVETEALPEDRLNRN